MRSASLLPGPVILLVTLCSLQGSVLSAAEITPGEQQMLEFARENYTKAKQALSRGRLTEFKSRQAQLEEYPLYPYLEYAYLLKRFSRVSDDQVLDFIDEYQDTPLAARINHRWLRSLAKRGDWARYLKHYRSDLSSIELKCYALWAEHKLGNTEAALSRVQALWLVSRSQPDACDPVFKLWRESGYLTDQLAWKRFTMAMNAGRVQLGRYLVRYMSKPQQRYAQIYRELRRKPERVASYGLFRNPDIRAEETVVYGMQRLARRHPEKANTIWRKYSHLHDFGKLNHRLVNRAITLGFARQNELSAYKSALEAHGFTEDTGVVEAGISMAIRLESWTDALSWIELLPAQTRAIEKWQYWRARASYTLGLAEEDPDKINAASQAITELAKNRSFYGFMAADHLQVDYSLNNERYTLDGNFLERFRRTPGVIRARELLAVGDALNARREWNHVTARLTNAQHYTAAHYAHDIGWYSQAIRSAIAAERWNDLTLRFPASHEQSFMRAGALHGLRDNWLLAIARQESAMAEDARSPKGAMGLMQLMPNTAKYVARKNGLKLKQTSELYDPDTNIRFGSAYLKQMYDEFGGNVIYATAAYNAGPHRVKSWLRDSSHLPMDIWIENIPYAETRQYVKNVLAFSVIYAYQREQQAFKMATSQYAGTQIRPMTQLETLPECSDSTTQC